jgi:hypothetical protein
MVYGDDDEPMSNKERLGWAAFIALGVSCVGAFIADCNGAFERAPTEIVQDLKQFPNCNINGRYLDCDLSAQQKQNENTIVQASGKLHDLKEEVWSLSSKHRDEVDALLQVRNPQQVKFKY